MCAWSINPCLIQPSASGFCLSSPADSTLWPLWTQQRLVNSLEALFKLRERNTHQEKFQKAMTPQMGQLSAQVQNLVTYVLQLPKSATESPTPLPMSTPTPVQVTLSTGSGIRLAPSECYSGDPGRCKTFLVDFFIHFEHSPQDFFSDRSKIPFMISHLTGRAKAWATAEWTHGSPLCQSLPELENVLKRTFNPVSSNREKARELRGIKRDRSPCATTPFISKN